MGFQVFVLTLIIIVWSGLIHTTLLRIETLLTRIFEEVEK